MKLNEFEKLKQYAEAEGMSEIGESLNLLIAFVSYEPYVSEEFFAALKKELREKLAWFEENTKIVEREITQKYTVEELEYL